jgi:hypothetical protein
MGIRHTPESFWARVATGDATHCWEWQGAKTSSGYGNLSYQGTIAQAHRVAYALTYGGIALPTGFRYDGIAKRYRRFVLHKCDNRACCNPQHLFLGSMRANLLDAYAKGRKVQPRSKHINAKLTARQVREIRRRYDAGLDQQIPIAKEFGVSQRTISLIVRRETYRDIQ